jgi:hypothetical protein
MDDIKTVSFGNVSRAGRYKLKEDKFENETCAVCFTYLMLRHNSYTTEFARVCRSSGGRREQTVRAYLKEVFR